MARVTPVATYRIGSGRRAVDASSPLDPRWEKASLTVPPSPDDLRPAPGPASSAFPYEEIRRRTDPPAGEPDMVRPFRRGVVRYLAAER